MGISDIRIKLVNNDERKLKAFASFTIDDCFVVHDVRVIDGSNGLFVAMPSKLAPNGDHIDIVHPKNTATRELINSAILEAYEQAKNSQE